MQGSGRRVAGSSQAKRMHSVMVGAQVALTILLLTVASAAGKGFLRIVNASLGYEPQNVMSVPIPIHETLTGHGRIARNTSKQIRTRIAAMPQSCKPVSPPTPLPPNNGWNQQFEVSGSTSTEKPEARLNLSIPAIFPCSRIPLLQGRLWEKPEVCAVRPSLLSIKPWRANSSRTATCSPAGPLPEPERSAAVQSRCSGSRAWLQIIGVVADARDDGLRNPIKPAIFVPLPAHEHVTQILSARRSPRSPSSMTFARNLSRSTANSRFMQVRDLQTG